MDTTIYNLVASMLNDARLLNVASNNMANSSTVGFKQDDAVFNTYLTSDVKQNNAIPGTIATITDYSPGPFKVTGRSLDIAVDGQGFLAVMTDAGIRYTRAGALQKGADGQLSLSNGALLLDYGGNAIALGESDNDIVITEDGYVYARGADKSAQYQVRGQIAVFKFADARALRKESGVLFVTDQEPIPAENYRVLQGTLEESNVNSLQAAKSVVELQRSFEAALNLTQDTYENSARVVKAVSD